MDDMAQEKVQTKRGVPHVGQKGKRREHLKGRWGDRPARRPADSLGSWGQGMRPDPMAKD